MNSHSTFAENIFVPFIVIYFHIDNSFARNLTPKIINTKLNQYFRERNRKLDIIIFRKKNIRLEKMCITFYL